MKHIIQNRLEPKWHYHINLLKGSLIFLVVLGHIIQGKLNESLIRYIIYSFHMPLFIGISGYLFNYFKAGELSLTNLLTKYKIRVLIPWIIAVIIYQLLLHWKAIDNYFSINNLLMAFVKPFYHLWFIPGFLSWVVITWISSKLKVSVKVLLILSCIISFGFLLIQEYPSWFNTQPLLHKTINIMQYTLRPYFYVFFVLGIFLRNYSIEKYSIFAIAFSILGFMATVILFYFPNKPFSIFIFFLFNIFLLILTLKVVKQGSLIRSKILEWVGINSLAIYLWHVIPIEISKVLIVNNLRSFYLTTFLLEILIIIAIFKLTKIKFINKYFFGFIKS
ncbi:MAG: acyltransferase family protein [Adhaeribacter sp.]